MKKRVLSLALALSLLLSMIPAGALSEEAEPAPVEEAPVAIVEEVAAPEANESLAEELPDEPQEAEPVEPPEEEPVETVAPVEDAAAGEAAATEEPGATEGSEAEPATPEPPEEEHPALDLVTEEEAGEAPNLFAPEQSPELFAGSADLRSVAALGSDGVQYAGVAYLSQAAFNSLDAGQQEDYVQMVDEITELLDEGVPVTNVVFSLNAEGVLGFNCAIPMETFAEAAEMLAEPVIAEEAAEEAVVEEVAEEAVAEEAIEPEEVQQDAESEPIVENVELAERVEIPLVKIPGLTPSAPNSANAQSFFTLYAGDEDYFSGQLSSAAKEYYDAGKAGIIDGGSNGFTIQTKNYTSEMTYVVDALSALMINYPESFDWKLPSGSVGWRASSQGGLYTVQVTLENSPHYSPSLEQDARTKVNKLVAEAYADAQQNYPNDIDYGVVKYLDAWICNNSFYNMIGTESDQMGTAEYFYCHSSYGVLLKGYGVCESYALAMSRLLDAAGIPNIYVTGTGGGGGHAWNYVQMSDGKYYMQDSTWNDPVYSDGVSRPNTNYLLCEGKSDHVPTGKRFTTGKEFNFPPLSDTRYVCKQAAAPNPTPRITPEPTHPVFGAKVSKITLSQESLTMAPKEEIKLTATVLPDYVADSVLKWTSNAPGVATVGADGTVKAVAVGSAQITCAATDGSGVSAVCNVTVRIPATKIEVSPAQVTLVRGQSQELKIYLYPGNVTSTSVTFSISTEDKKILSYAKQKVTGIGVGKGKITFRTKDGTNLEAVCEVTVLPLPVSKITLSQSKLTLEKGATQKLTASIEPRNADNQELKWTSTADDVATVEDGEIRAISAGQATIRCEATDGSGKSAECQVTVNPRKVSAITLSQHALTLTKGEGATLTAEVGPEDADNKALRWTSSANGIATVDGGEVKAVGPGWATIRAEATDGSKVFAECQVTVNPLKVSNITLGQDELTLTKLDSEKLTVSIEPAEADNQVLRWTSTAQNVATVEDGEIRAVGVGQATIRAEATDGSEVFAECRVTVNPLKIATIALNPEKLTLSMGSSKALTAVIEPAEADNQVLKWTSTAVGVATVENGEVKAVDVGDAIIRAEATDGSGAFAECQVTVTLVPPEKVVLSATKLTLGKGDTAQLSVKEFVPEGSGAEVTYTSGNEGVATVDRETGLVTAVKTGSATITAKTDNGKTAKCTVTVKAAPSSVALNKKELKLSAGEKPSEKLKATLSKNSASTLKWESSEPGVATVDPDGTVTAVGAGEAIITVATHNYDPEKPDDAKNAKLIAACAVTVAPDPASISGLPEKVALGKGETLPLEPVAKDVEGEDTYAEFHYTSSDATVVGVDAKGKLTAKKLSVSPVTIAVHTNNGTTATVEVEVQPAPVKADLTLSASSRELGIGEHFELTATLAEGKASKLMATSSNANIAAVKEVEPGRFLITTEAGKSQKTGTATITVKTFNGVNKTCKVTVKKAPTDAEGMLKIAIKPETARLAEGQTATLKASYKSGFGGGYSWDVINGEDGGEATFDETAKEVTLTAVKAGTVTVTATSYNGLATATCPVTIEAGPAVVTLSPSEATLGVKETLQLTPTAVDDQGRPVTLATYTYEVTNDEPKGCVSVDAKKGKITAKAEGTATVTATAENGASAQCMVTVKAAPTSVTITNNPKTLGIGEAWTLEAKISATKNKQEIPCAGGVTFTSSATSVLAVDKNTGALTAKKAGSAKITAKTFNNKAVSVTIAVKAAPTQINLNETEVTLGVGEPNIQLTASFELKKNQYGHVTWTSDDEGIVTVENPAAPEKGVLKAKQTGTATITASVYNANGEPHTAQCVVTVKAAPTAEAMYLTLPKTTLGVGEPMTASFEYADGTAGAYEFAIDKVGKTTYATVNKTTGVIKGAKAGEAQVYVKAYNDAVSAPQTITIVAAPTKVELLNKVTKLGVGETWDLDAKVSAGKADVTEQVHYEFNSSNDSLIHVDKETGKLTAKELPAGKKSASAKITAKAYNGKSASVTITVVAAPEGASLNKDELMLAEGQSEKLSVSYDPSNSFGNVIWSSDDEQVATVVNGKVTAVHAGTARIAAKIYNQEPLVCEVTVKAAPSAANATLVPAKAKIGVNESVQLSLDYDGPANVVTSYKSSKTAYATVSAKGVVKGVKVGKSTITATLYNGEKLTYEIEVVKAPTRLTIVNIPEGNALKVGETWEPEFDAGGYGSDDLTGVVTGFTSSNAKIAKFENGMLTAVGEGSTKITCKTYNGKTASFTLAVNAAE